MHMHSHSHSSPTTSSGAEVSQEKKLQHSDDLEKYDADGDLHQAPSHAEAMAQLIAVGVLEFGVVLHRCVAMVWMAVSVSHD